jgi:hypothetical protein
MKQWEEYYENLKKYLLYKIAPAIPATLYLYAYEDICLLAKKDYRKILNDYNNTCVRSQITPIIGIRFEDKSIINFANIARNLNMARKKILKESKK